ncbi:MAG: hypothetical protein QM755_08230 [Luteolibacter sp.]
MDAGRLLETKAASAFSDDRAIADDKQVAESVTIFASPDGRTLLIREHIPNDASPCDNYLLVRDRGATLSTEWIEFRDKPSGLYAENARVLAVTADSLWYAHADGKPRVTRLDTLQKRQSPRLPG